MAVSDTLAAIKGEHQFVTSYQQCKEPFYLSSNFVIIEEVYGN
jgi:hypothetical protein